MTEAVDTSAIHAELAKRSRPREAKTVLDLVDAMRPEIVKVLGPEMPERLGRVFQTEIRRNPKLMECTAESILGALMLSAQLALEPGPLGHVYLVPFKNEVTFILGYKGMTELAYRSGLLKRIEANVVREGDSFEFRHGSRAFLDYTPSGPPGERDRTAVYALAELKTGGKVFSVLYPEQVEARRKRSPAARADSGPWVTDTDAMWRKSAVRALAPSLPMTRPFARGMERDEAEPVLPKDVIEGEASEDA